ncbi:MAG: SufE family protein [Devosiaceae bacterium]|nr:SufE family protein [Devosiaceae bacterium]
MSNTNDYKEISENLSFLDDWEDRYKYLIEIGEKLPPINEAEKTEENKVNGCVSQVWLCSTLGEKDGNTHIYFRGDSDALIVKGLVAVLIAYYSGKSAKWIAQNDVGKLFDEMGLREHLTSQRSNGLNSMISSIMALAQTLA